MTKHDLDDAECPHCDEESIRDAQVADVEEGWENNPPSPDDLANARVCYICLCGWTISGELARRGPNCDSDEITR